MSNIMCSSCSTSCRPVFVLHCTVWMRAVIVATIRRGYDFIGGTSISSLPS